MESDKVDLDVVVDLNAKTFSNCLDHQRRPTEGVGGVDPVLAMPGDVHIQVTGDAEDLGCGGRGVESHEHDHIASSPTNGPEVCEVVETGPRVGANHQERQVVAGRFVENVGDLTVDVGRRQHPLAGIDGPEDGEHHDIGHHEQRHDYDL